MPVGSGTWLEPIAAICVAVEVVVAAFVAVLADPDDWSGNSVGVGGTGVMELALAVGGWMAEGKEEVERREE